MTEKSVINRDLVIAKIKQDYPEKKGGKKAKTPGEADIERFLHLAEESQLDPLRNQLHLTPRGRGWVVITGIDGFRLVAARTGAAAGVDEAVYEDVAERDIPYEDWTTDRSGKRKKVQKSVRMRVPGIAKVTVYRIVQGVRCPFTAEARWSEYYPGTPTWRRMPFLMLRKCAEALALRMAFPQELSGLYTFDEMEQADAPPSIRNAGEVTPEKPKPAKKKPAKKAPAKKKSAKKKGKAESREKILEQLRNFAKKERKDLGFDAVWYASTMAAQALDEEEPSDPRALLKASTELLIATLAMLEDPKQLKKIEKEMDDE